MTGTIPIVVGVLLMAVDLVPADARPGGNGPRNRGDSRTSAEKDVRKNLTQSARKRPSDSSRPRLTKSGRSGRQRLQRKASGVKRSAARTSSQRPLRRFRIEDGTTVHQLYQSRRVSGHVSLRREARPSLVFATPAGNSGIGVWFADVGRDAGEALRMLQQPREIESDGMVGLGFAVEGPGELVSERILLDTVRSLRDQDTGHYENREEVLKRALATLEGAPRNAGVKRLESRIRQWLRPTVRAEKDGSVTVERQSVAGPLYRLQLIPKPGTRIVSGKDGQVTLRGQGKTRFEVRVFVDRPPSVPLEHVLTPEARSSQRGRIRERNLGLLSYEDGIVAGSPNYLTPFGRDQAITASSMADDASVEFLGTAAGALLDSVSSRGEVAHEKSPGDQAVFERLEEFARDVKRGEKRVTRRSLAALEKPTYDYAMIDGEYLLPQVVGALLARADRAEVDRVLNADRIDALARLATRIESQTRSRGTPRTGDLISLRPGRDNGNWRDSGIGLGGGRVPLDVSAYLVPSALSRLGEVLRHPNFPRQQFLAALRARSPRAARMFARSGSLEGRAAKWRATRDRFWVRLDGGTAKKQLREYLDQLPREDREALRKQKTWDGSTVGDVIDAPGESGLGTVEFPAVALDARGEAVPVMNTDEVFDLFYGSPSPGEVIDSVKRMFQPFPIGLATPVGLVIANPAYSQRKGDFDTFSKTKYHGSLMWGWPQQMLLKALDRQAERLQDNPEAQRVLSRARRQLTTALERVERAGYAASEAWSWKGESGRIEAIPFGQSAGDTDRANPVQAWTLIE